MKKMIEIRNKQLLTATVGDFVDALICAIQGESGCGTEISSNTPDSDKKYIYSIKGLAQLLDCSVPTAQRIKSSGVIDAAIFQTGRTIVIDADRALDLLRLSNQK